MKGNRMLVLAYLQKRVNKAHFHEAKINFPQSDFWYLPHRLSLKEYQAFGNTELMKNYSLSKTNCLGKNTILFTGTSPISWI